MNLYYFAIIPFNTSPQTLMCCVGSQPHPQHPRHKVRIPISVLGEVRDGASASLLLYLVMKRREDERSLAWDGDAASCGGARGGRALQKRLDIRLTGSHARSDLIAVKQYSFFKMAREDTAKRILESVGVRLRRSTCTKCAYNQLR
jgi:hypothetical protein